MVRPIPGDEEWPTRGSESWTWEDGRASYGNDVLSYSYRFVEDGLAGVTVHQAGHDTPSFELRLQPALPDLRRPFSGTARTRFVMHVNGQAGHGEGEISAVWLDSDRIEVAIRPTAPHWLSDRPMVSTIVFRDGGAVDVRTRRITP